MRLPLTYNVRSLRARWPVTLLATVGVALVVAVFVVLTAMASGLRIALRSTGRTDNAMVLQTGASSEMISGISRDSAAAVSVDPRVARAADGRALVSPEILAFVNLKEIGDGSRRNVAVRGVTTEAFEVRGGIRLVEGRRFRPGFSEVMVGQPIRERFGLAVGKKVRIRKRDCDVVGVFASAGSGFESEIWGDLDTLAGSLGFTGGFQAVVLRLADPSTLPELKRRLESETRLKVQVQQERQFYEDQAGPVGRALMGLALFVSFIMSLGAVFAAMNTMYAIVSARTREIGVLRALGFSRSAILISMVTESVVLAGLGGVLGCLLALPANGLTSVASSGNFAEICFAFRTTPSTLAAGLAFAIAIGVAGGLLPALRAARLPLTAALREA